MNDVSNISISVITIVRNNESLLPRSIQSVLSQDFTDFEYIIVNDGSTDSTRDVIDRYSSNNSKVRPVHLEENIGRSMARNTGLDLATGHYIFFVDADDYIPEDALGTLYQIAEKNNSDIVYAGTRCFNGSTGEWVAKHYTDGLINCEKHNIKLKDHLPLVDNHQIVGRLFKRILLTNNNIRFSTTRKNGEDVLFSFYTAFYANNISLVQRYKSYYYSIGNFILKANESKLNDARDNVLETILFSLKNGDQDLQRAMWIKGAVFSLNLRRADRVFEGDDDGLLSYISTLSPLVSGLDEKYLDSIPAYNKEYVGLLKSGDYAEACRVWKWKCLHTDKIINAKSKLEYFKKDTSRLALDLDEIYSSNSWRLTVPFRSISSFLSNIRNNNKSSGSYLSLTKVSVIIPVYNVHDYLQACLDSVINQSLREIEIICINDFSTDDSANILDSYAKTDSRIVVISHDLNKGLAAARNTGIDVATGEYIYFLDSDDYLACDTALYILYQAARDDASDEVVGGVLRWHEDTGEKYTGWHSNYLASEERGKSLKQLPQLWANVVAWNKLLRRELLGDSVRFNEGLRKHEDNPFSCKIHILATKITIIPVTTYIYRQSRQDSLMATTKVEDAYYRCTYCSDIFSFIESNVNYHIYRDMYYPMYSRQLVQGASILSQFNPTNKQIIDLMSSWHDAICVMGSDLVGVPDNLRDIFINVLHDDHMTAWNKAIEWNIGKKPDQVALEPSESRYVSLAKDKLLNINNILDSHKNIHSEISLQINYILNSRSWKYTRVLRKVASVVKGK